MGLIELINTEAAGKRRSLLVYGVFTGVANMAVMASANAAAYRDGWFRTGDLGRVVEDDVVELMGRQKELISRAGNKVTPTEIEAAICSHPDIAAAMAIGIADPVLGERIHVLLVPRAGATISGEALRRHLEPRLERYKRPDAYYVADSLPLGRTGKADRGELRSLLASAALARLDA